MDLSIHSVSVRLPSVQPLFHFHTSSISRFLHKRCSPFSIRVRTRLNPGVVDALCIIIFHQTHFFQNAFIYLRTSLLLFPVADDTASTIAVVLDRPYVSQA